MPPFLLLVFRLGNVLFEWWCWWCVCRNKVFGCIESFNELFRDSRGVKLGVLFDLPLEKGFEILECTDNIDTIIELSAQMLDFSCVATSLGVGIKQTSLTWQNGWVLSTFSLLSCTCSSACWLWHTMDLSLGIAMAIHHIAHPIPHMPFRTSPIPLYHSSQNPFHTCHSAHSPFHSATQHIPFHHATQHTAHPTLATQHIAHSIMPLNTLPIPFCHSAHNPFHPVTQHGALSLLANQHSAPNKFTPKYPAIPCLIWLVLYAKLQLCHAVEDYCGGSILLY